MDFCAIDVETANADLGSICAIGMAFVRDGRVADTWGTLIDPEDYFDGMNISIHGIDEEAVEGKPTFADIAGELRGRIGGAVVVHHTGFDRAAIRKSAERYRSSPPDWRWLDSARVVRRAWPDRYARSGYGLAVVAEDLGIAFQHHDPVEDARAASLILLEAAKVTGLDIAGLLQRVEEPILPRADISEAFNPEGALAGNVIVFTGKLTMTRDDVSIQAAQAGCVVGDSVTKKTTLLVVGDQDIQRLVGHTKSSKHRKAENLIVGGQSIRILGETDFLALVTAG